MFINTHDINYLIWLYKEVMLGLPRTISTNKNWELLLEDESSNYKTVQVQELIVNFLIKFIPYRIKPKITSRNIQLWAQERRVSEVGMTMSLGKLSSRNEEGSGPGFN